MALSFSPVFLAWIALGVFADLVRALDAGSDQVLHALEGVQLGERFVQVVAGDGVFLDEEFDEQCLAESAALFIGAAFVEFLGSSRSLRHSSMRVTPSPRSSATASIRSLSFSRCAAMSRSRSRTLSRGMVL